MEEVDSSLSAIFSHAINAAMAGFDQLSRVACRAIVARRRIAIRNEIDRSETERRSDEATSTW